MMDQGRAAHEAARPFIPIGAAGKLVALAVVLPLWTVLMAVGLIWMTIIRLGEWR